jgi:hypothetical protein
LKRNISDKFCCLAGRKINTTAAAAAKDQNDEKNIEQKPLVPFKKAFLCKRIMEKGRRMINGQSSEQKHRRSRSVERFKIGWGRIKIASGYLNKHKKLLLTPLDKGTELGGWKERERKRG